MSLIIDASTSFLLQTLTFILVDNLSSIFRHQPPPLSSPCSLPSGFHERWQPSARAIVSQNLQSLHLMIPSSARRLYEPCLLDEPTKDCVDEGDQPPSAMPCSFKFHVPEGCRNFTLFPLLPPEIRQRVWESYLSTPGVHFLKLQSVDGSWRWSDNLEHGFVTVTDLDDVGEETDELSKGLLADKKPREKLKSCFMPVGPCPKADVSHYQALRRQLATLSRICVESRNIVRRLCARPDTLRLNNGNIISLGGSSDLVCLEYLPPSLFQSNTNLHVDPDCPELQHIRRVAVRFSHSWRPANKPCRCHLCSAAPYSAHEAVYPTHLYQFLARHLPNLEEFFFIDYFIVHKSRAQHPVLQASNAINSRVRNERFQAGNRLYHEASPEDWVMSKEVSQVTLWLRTSYLRYAKASKLCRHRHPEKVRFSVLACEWNIHPPVQKQSMALQSTSPLFGGPTKGSGSRCKRAREIFEHVFEMNELRASGTLFGNAGWQNREEFRGDFAFSPRFITSPQQLPRDPGVATGA